MFRHASTDADGWLPAPSQTFGCFPSDDRLQTSSEIAVATKLREIPRAGQDHPQVLGDQPTGRLRVAVLPRALTGQLARNCPDVVLDVTTHERRGDNVTVDLDGGLYRKDFIGGKPGRSARPRRPIVRGPSRGAVMPAGDRLPLRTRAQ